MFGVAQRHGRGLILLSVVAAVALSACGGGSPTPAASVANSNPPTTAPISPTATAASTGDGAAILLGAGGALASLTSYKFHMTLAGTDSVNQLTDLTGNAASSSATGVVTFTGTVITKPGNAAEVTTTGLHVIFVGGFDYMDVGGTGSFAKIPADSTSISDPFTPAQVFSTVRVNGYSNSGSETKNAVECDHYTAGASALAEFGSVSGVKNATWSADLWISKVGGYPVSVAITAKAKDGTTVYETTFDLSNINDAANKVTAPDNVMGA
jgi:hypothetical protein